MVLQKVKDSFYSDQCPWAMALSSRKEDEEICRDSLTESTYILASCFTISDCQMKFFFFFLSVSICFAILVSHFGVDRN